MKTLAAILLVLITHAQQANAESLDADLLIVGGTESGCAAAIQAARMGVKRIVLINDIEWVGGQFSAEGVGAIDENRAAGYDGTVPIPRSGLFRELMDHLEAVNRQTYGGVARPGNTRVITTVRPTHSEEAFRWFLSKHELDKRILRKSNWIPTKVLKDGDRVRGVVFDSKKRPTRTLTVHARLTIDASDWGDVIKAAGASYDFGIDAKSEYNEPSAPETSKPRTDMNPITWCMILVEQRESTLFPKPASYDAQDFLGKWKWIDEDFAYTSRRLVDGQTLKNIKYPDVLLINNPHIDYPLDVYPATVATALEDNERGASQRNIVELNVEQRRLVFDDAKRRSLAYYYDLQQRFPKFRRMRLSDEFNTDDRLPPKPYIRESLRLKARHVIKEQEVTGFEGRANYANTMFHDGVFCWQFEMDFHPTMRRWLDESQASAGPWEADFRGNRRFHRGGTGRAIFPLRSFVPEKVKGLLGAQKNLGYTSIVGSSCRLHDQSMAAGQACGAVAAVSLRQDIEPADISFDRHALSAVWDGLLDAKTGVPVAIWPFADVDPKDRDFSSIQHLALRRLFPLQANDTRFQPDRAASQEWLSELEQRVVARGYACSTDWKVVGKSRRDIAKNLWSELAPQDDPPFIRRLPKDADGDGILDSADPLPFTKGTVSWAPIKVQWPTAIPHPLPKDVVAINFTTANAPNIAGFENDWGKAMDKDHRFGWARKITQQNRLRQQPVHPLRNGFVFTREQDEWRLKIDNGMYRVILSIGDSAYEQPGQHVTIEGNTILSDVSTSVGEFKELDTHVAVTDGELTVTIGTPQGGSNTTINWLVVVPAEE